MHLDDGFVYVLRLEDGCYYVGWTKNLKQRLTAHWKGNGAKWTCLHRPIEVVLVREGTKVTENNVTRKMIERCGKDVVRGGYFTICNSSHNLPITAQEQVTLLDHEQHGNHQGESRITSGTLQDVQPIEVPKMG